MNMKRKYIIGIAILVALLCLGLVMCSMSQGTDKDAYEGETEPMEAAEDIFGDEEEYGTSETDTDKSSDAENITGENGVEGSDTDQSSDTDKSSGAENITGENGVEGSDTNESSNDTKNEQENGNNDIEDGWTPFY